MSEREERERERDVKEWIGGAGNIITGVDDCQHDPYHKMDPVWM